MYVVIAVVVLLLLLFCVSVCLILFFYAIPFMPFDNAFIVSVFMCVLASFRFFVYSINLLAFFLFLPITLILFFC